MWREVYWARMVNKVYSIVLATDPVRESSNKQKTAETAFVDTNEVIEICLCQHSQPLVGNRIPTNPLQ